MPRERKADTVNSDDVLQSAIDTTNQILGEHTVVRLGDQGIVPVDVISTGIMELDMALGVGGLPRGRIVEIYGPESSGKSTLAIQVVAHAQAAGGKALYVDTEHALDPVYARALGVDVPSLLFSQPDTAEDALGIVERFAKTGQVAVIVVDSVAALTPRAELEGDFGQAHVGLQARLMSQAMRKLVGIASSSNTLIIWINQLRQMVGVLYGPTETQPGGRALKFYSSVRLDVRRRDQVKDNGEAIANKVKIKVVKNKVGIPLREVEVELRYGVGFVRESSLLNVAENFGVIRKSGAWYYYGDTQLGQGSSQASAFLRENPNVRDEIETTVHRLNRGDEPGTEGDVT